jgi:hypothetical protein
MTGDTLAMTGDTLAMTGDTLTMTGDIHTVLFSRPGIAPGLYIYKNHREWSKNNFGGAFL